MEDETMSSRGEEGSSIGSLCVCLCDGGKTFSSFTFWMKINLKDDKVKSSSIVPCPYESCFEGPFHHYACGSAVVEGIMYLIGGMNPAYFTNTNNISSMDTTTMDVDPTFYPAVPATRLIRLPCAYTSNTCSMDEDLTTHLIVPRLLPCVLTLAKKIYIFGTTWSNPLYNIGPLNLPWGEVLDTESMSIKALAHPPVSFHTVLLQNNVSGYAIINNDKQFLFSFSHSDRLLLYDVEGDKWTEFYDHPLGRVDQFLSRCPVINNVLYTYHRQDGCVYAFDLNDDVWFEEPVKFLLKKEIMEVGFLVKEKVKEVESLYHFKTCKSSDMAEGDLHHLGNGLLCAVFLEKNGDDSGGRNQLHYVLFTPVVLISSDGLEFSIRANVIRRGCYEVGGWCSYFSSIALPDHSVEECVEEKLKLDESAQTGTEEAGKVSREKISRKIVEH